MSRHVPSCCGTHQSSCADVVDTYINIAMQVQAEAQRQAPTLHQDKYSCGVVAIPGYDPAVLAIWDLQVLCV